mgnify:CR=1 FL=1
MTYLLRMMRSKPPSTWNYPNRIIYSPYDGRSIISNIRPHQYDMLTMLSCLKHQRKWQQRNIEDHGTDKWWSGTTTVVASTSRTCQAFDIVHLFKIMNETRYTTPQIVGKKVGKVHLLLFLSILSTICQKSWVIPALSSAQKTCITPREHLHPKRAYYKDHFMNLSYDRFIQRPRYMDVHMPHDARKSNRLTQSCIPSAID